MNAQENNNHEPVKIYLSAFKQLVPLFEVKQSSDNFHCGFVSLSEILPDDLDEVIGLKGHAFQDEFTKFALYISKSLTSNIPYSADKMGVICATNYGNFKNGLKINEAAMTSTNAFSAQLFPNATYSSAAVNVSLELGARGINLTLTSGDTGAVSALALSEGYLRRGRINDCILLVGDDYSKFTAQNASYNQSLPLTFLSSIGGLTLTTERKSNKDLEFIMAYSARSDQAVFNMLNKNLGADWPKKYLIHVCGPRRIIFDSNCQDLIEAYLPHVSFGSSNTLWQIGEVINQLHFKNHKHVVIFSSSAYGLGACVFAKTNAL